MTRLAESDIATVTELMDALDAELLACTQATLAEIAQYATGKPVEFSAVTTGVVPITSGLGTIGGFAQTLAGILKHLGVDAFVTQATDVAGIYEARLGSACQMYADDNLFMAVNNQTNTMSENGDATGRGFAAALDLAAKGVVGKQVLVAGAGPVGKAAAEFLAVKGADIVLYDIDESKLTDTPYETTTTVAGRQFSLVIEATTSENVITEELLTEDAIVSAPGVPLGVEATLARTLADCHRLIHNPLELGTAVMMADVLNNQ